MTAVRAGLPPMPPGIEKLRADAAKRATAELARSLERTR